MTLNTSIIDKKIRVLSLKSEVEDLKAKLEVQKKKKSLKDFDYDNRRIRLPIYAALMVVMLIVALVIANKSVLSLLFAIGAIIFFILTIKNLIQFLVINNEFKTRKTEKKYEESLKTKEPQLEKEAAELNSLIGNEEAVDLRYLAGLVFDEKGETEAAAAAYLDAASKGHEGAVFHVGLGLIEGKGFRTDINEGVSLLDKAKSLGSADAACKLGEIYTNGKIGTISQDIYKAKSYFEFAMNHIDDMTYYVKASFKRNYGRLLAFSNIRESRNSETGKVTYYKNNYSEFDKGVGYLKESANEGDSDAAEALRKLKSEYGFYV